MLYKVFVDDSGNKEYIDSYSYDNAENPPSTLPRTFWLNNYFVLAGVRVKQDDLGLINGEIVSIKRKYFKTQKVEIKSSWLRNPTERKKYYFDKFPINEKQLEKFVFDLHELIAHNADRLKLYGIVFDKRYYKRRISTTSPLLKTTQCLAERIEKTGGDNVLIFDQMERSKNVTSGQHGKIIRVCTNNDGVEKIYISEYKHILKVSFSSSQTENLLQIADVCAYNIFRQFVDNGRQWADKGAKNLPAYKFFAKIVCNLHYATDLRHEEQVRGYGLCLIPDVAKHNWMLRKNCEKKKNPT